MNKNIIIDLGISFKKLKDSVDIKNINCVFFTHIHGDHFKLSTLKLLLENNSKVLIFCGEEISKVLDKEKIKHHKINPYSYVELPLNDGKLLSARVEKLTHDVLTFGYKFNLVSLLGQETKIFYATDTGNLEGISTPGYDYYFLESNYRYKNLCSFDALRVTQTHLSNDQCDNYYIVNKKKNSELIKLHKSSRNW